MPETKWKQKHGCSFKCGAIHLSSFKSMVKHEEECWLNPENRACQTCVNEVMAKFIGWYGDRDRRVYGCDVGNKEFFHKEVPGRNLVMGCKHWKTKGETDGD